MKNKLTIPLELSDLELKNLQSFIDFSIAEDTNMYLRYEALEKVLKHIFTAKEYEENKERVLHSDIRCKCGHEENFHSLMGERLCCSEGCPCMLFTKIRTP